MASYNTHTDRSLIANSYSAIFPVYIDIINYSFAGIGTFILPEIHQENLIASDSCYASIWIYFIDVLGMLKSS